MANGEPSCCSASTWTVLTVRFRRVGLFSRLGWTVLTQLFVFLFVFVYLLSEKSPVDNTDSRERSPKIHVRRVQWITLPLVD